ncbi:HAMP domain-containing sensor histidine kinase [Desulfoluna sp.]|uniref:sensor histidine kinase n=1 Tax=Desulfoluna sp. TaxID=2045199 RepID=UPI0026047586|nr:sensor histidine kinase [Desulfoluna sp.]
MNHNQADFVPGERLGPDEIQLQSGLFTSLEMNDLSAALPVMFLVLNRHRQIVFSNRRFVELVGSRDSAVLLGQRPGEAMGCVHALSSPEGCGSTESCWLCGAAKSILMTQKERAAIEACVITCEGRRVFELQVWTSPVWRDGELFTLFSAVDISAESRRLSLERTFFHDISNTVAAISGAAELLVDGSQETPNSGGIETIFNASEWLLDEIRSHKKLMEAENGELEVSKTAISSLETLKQCLQLYARNKSTHSCSLILSPDSSDCRVVTDPVLLRRILINMVKNAIEATSEGGEVVARCRPHGADIIFSVTNPGFIPRHVQLGIFQRTFSTKGAGRGVGTYSMKLFAERYLGGTILFTTSPEEGTTFTLSLPSA